MKDLGDRIGELEDVVVNQERYIGRLAAIILKAYHNIRDEPEVARPEETEELLEHPDRYDISQQISQLKQKKPEPQKVPFLKRIATTLAIVGGLILGSCAGTAATYYLLHKESEEQHLEYSINVKYPEKEPKLHVVTEWQPVTLDAEILNLRRLADEGKLGKIDKKLLVKGVAMRDAIPDDFKRLEGEGGCEIKTADNIQFFVPGTFSEKLRRYEGQRLTIIPEYANRTFASLVEERNSETPHVSLERMIISKKRGEAPKKSGRHHLFEYDAAAQEYKELVCDAKRGALKQEKGNKTAVGDVAVFYDANKTEIKTMAEAKCRERQKEYERERSDKANQTKVLHVQPIGIHFLAKDERYAMAELFNNGVCFGENAPEGYEKKGCYQLKSLSVMPKKIPIGEVGQFVSHIWNLVAIDTNAAQQRSAYQCKNKDKRGYWCMTESFEPYEQDWCYMGEKINSTTKLKPHKRIQKAECEETAGAKTQQGNSSPATPTQQQPSNAGTPAPDPPATPPGTPKTGELLRWH